MKLTLAVLKHVGACKSGIDFFVRNNLEGFPIDKIHEVKGSYSNYLTWINEKIDDIISSQNVESNIQYTLLPHKKNSKNCIRVYDSHGNCTKFSYTVPEEKEDEHGNITIVERTYIEEREYTYINNVLSTIKDAETNEILLSIPQF
ncbi:hypothetical protein ACQ27_gp352 [Klebsiella phage K64-1]|uniref:hypothetical protein n=1 Tax=Klebsiella phage K64-1 TaxID=1439894 RepID=UPI00248D1C21|nr:hypothetical protein ACQ27_gp352 [Klebsiella phage K64-1]